MVVCALNILYILPPLVFRFDYYQSYLRCENIQIELQIKISPLFLFSDTIIFQVYSLILDFLLFIYFCDYEIPLDAYFITVTATTDMKKRQSEGIKSFRCKSFRWNDPIYVTAFSKSDLVGKKLVVKMKHFSLNKIELF